MEDKEHQWQQTSSPAHVDQQAVLLFIIFSLEAKIYSTVVPYSTVPHVS